MQTVTSSALIGLGALGILFGWPMQCHTPGGISTRYLRVRIRRYQASPTLFNGQECRFSYCTPEQGHPVDLVLVATKATALDQAAKEIAPFVGPDTAIVSVINGIASEEKLDALYPGRVLWSVALGMDATRTGRTLVCKARGCIQLGERGRQPDPAAAGGGRLSDRLRHPGGGLHRHSHQTVAEADDERGPEPGVGGV